MFTRVDKIFVRGEDLLPGERDVYPSSPPRIDSLGEFEIDTRPRGR
jgi:hypothetical protein